jgi:hypothetical protein
LNPRITPSASNRRASRVDLRLLESVEQELLPVRELALAERRDVVAEAIHGVDQERALQRILHAARAEEVARVHHEVVRELRLSDLDLARPPGEPA